MFIKIALLVVFFTVLIIVGIVSRKKADSVNSFVLGGRSIGPWMTAFAYGTTYFSAVIFVGYAGQFGFKYGLASTWIGLGNALIGSLLIFYDNEETRVTALTLLVGAADAGGQFDIQGQHYESALSPGQGFMPLVRYVFVRPFLPLALRVFNSVMGALPFCSKVWARFCAAP